MVRKIPFYEMWDWKSILGVAIAILIVILIFSLMYLASISNAIKIKMYDGQTSAYLIKIDTLTRMKQNLLGNEIVNKYNVHYLYVINGEVYGGIEFIEGNLNNEKFLLAINNKKKDFIIRYDLQNPKKSTIEIK